MVQQKVDDTHLLVSLSNAKGQNFILKLSVLSNVLKVLITDKSTAERWKCTYESSYIENVTRKTGNFKQFMVFVSMLKAGLLKTNECVFVELLTQDELELRRRKGHNGTNFCHRNRKYLILIYQVEFDKIHYPLPLEYCGKPDPEVLQFTIRKLENDMGQIRSEMAKQMMKCKTEVEMRETSFQKLISQLNSENKCLYEENNRLKKQLGDRQTSDWASGVIKKLEAQLASDRAAFNDRIYRLEIENKKLTSILEGRASRGHIQTRLRADSPVNRTASLPRSGSSYYPYQSGGGDSLKKRIARKSFSPVRKESFSSQDRTISSRKSKVSRPRTRSISSEGQRSLDRTKISPKKQLDSSRALKRGYK